MHYVLRGRIAKANPYQLDKTLTVEGAAAESKATGEIIANAFNEAKNLAENAQTVANTKVPLAGGRMTGLLRIPMLAMYPADGFTQTMRFLNESGRYKIEMNAASNNRFQLLQYDVDTQKYEYYRMPVVTPGLSENVGYKILTSKELISIKEGGTGANSVEQALENLGAVAKTGDTMVGELNMGGHKVSGVADPTEYSDAVNKEYADTIKETAEGKCSRKNCVISLTKGAEGWIENTQIVSVESVLADLTKCDVITSPVEDSREVYNDCIVRCTEQGDGTLTFKCDDVPETNLNVNVLVLI